MMFKERKVPLKNYIYLGVILLISILLIIYFYLWYLTYEENKLNTPIIDRYLEVINYNELDNYLVENKDAYVYVSILENEKIRKFEIDFKNFINDNSLRGKLLYLDATEYLKNNRIEEEYTVNDKDIFDVPCIMVFKDGNLKQIYDIKDYNFDFSELKSFLEKEDVIE